MNFEIVNAQTIERDLPANLSALRLVNFPTAGQTLRLCAVGDIGLSGRVGDVLNLPYGPAKIFGEVAPLLKSVDISFGNLESPLAGDIAPGKLFSGPVSGAGLLKKSGFSLIHLANNHVYDYGRDGLVATIKAVQDANLTILGVGETKSAAKQVVRTDVGGLRVGWLGCGRTLVDQDELGPNFWEFDEEELHNAVVRYRSDVDLLIVSIHIGLMHMDYPRPEHKVMAEKLLDAGANLILMHHAHVLQGVHVTAGRTVCCYNLGNFVFDWQEGNVKMPVLVREQNEGAVFHFVMDSNGIAQAAAIPVWIDNDCAVRWATGTRGLEILTRLSRISQDLECDYEAAFKRQRAERHTSGILKVVWFHFRRGNWSFVLDSAKQVRLEHLGMLVRWLGKNVKRFAKVSTA